MGGNMSIFEEFIILVIAAIIVAGVTKTISDNIN
jgi:hypothetical protein